MERCPPDSSQHRSSRIFPSGDLAMGPGRSFENVCLRRWRRHALQQPSLFALSHGNRALSLAVRNDSIREDPWRVLVQLAAERERLPLEAFAPMIDHSEYAFQDEMAPVSDGVSGERFAKNGEIMILTEYPRQLASL